MTTVESMLYRMRISCPWRDLSRAFGPWSKVYKRFNAWCATGKWLKVFQARGGGVVEPDLEWVFVDGSYAKAHQHSAGATDGQEQAIGKSRAAFSGARSWLPVPRPASALRTRCAKDVQIYEQC